MKYAIYAGLIYLLFGRGSKGFAVRDPDGEGRVFLVELEGDPNVYAGFIIDPFSYGMDTHLNEQNGVDIFQGDQFWEYMIFPIGGNKGVVVDARTGKILRTVKR